MSVEASGWAFRMRLPAKPKIVLLALADQTDERTGRVCYGRTDMKHIAEKATVSERSLYRYLAALIRNGYLIRESGKDKGVSSQFWLCLDRPPSELAEWQWNIILPEDDGDPGDIDDEAQHVEGYATAAEPQDNTRSAESGIPPLPIRGETRLSEEHRNIKPIVGQQRDSTFSRQAQDLERDGAAIQKKAASENAKFFVIYASRAWDAWVDYRRRTGVTPATMTTCGGFGEHAGKRGWYMPSLFPPSTPDSPALSPEDTEAFLNIK